MSRRVTTKTQMTDGQLAKQALDAAGIAYTQSGDYLNLTSGNFRNARLNLITGEISGDTDYGHTEAKFGILHQHYSEAKVKQEFLQAGGMLDSRELDQEGSVVLMWNVG